MKKLICKIFGHGKLIGFCTGKWQCMRCYTFVKLDTRKMKSAGIRKPNMDKFIKQINDVI